MGSCPTLGNELSGQTHVLTKQEILLGRGAQVESRGVREPRRTALQRLTVSGFMVTGLVSGWSLASRSDSESFWWCVHHSAETDASGEDSGRRLDMRCHILTFPKLFRLVVAY